MPSPLAELRYESWIVRRTSTSALHVLHAAVARGPSEVLVPLPWPEARLLDEAPTRAPFWTLWDFVVPWWEPPLQMKGRPVDPLGSRDAASAGERVARLLSRSELGPERASRFPSSWDGAQSFLWWPALRGLAAWVSRVKDRELAPVALEVEGTSYPFRTKPGRVVITVGTTAEFADFYVIDPEQLVTLPAGGFDSPRHGTGLSLPGWAEPQDHVHWDRGWGVHQLQRRSDAVDDLVAETRARTGKA
jgi:hypothetical protein